MFKEMTGLVFQLRGQRSSISEIALRDNSVTKN